MRFVLSCLLGFIAIATIVSQACAAERLRLVTLEFAPFVDSEDRQVAGPRRDVIATVCAEAQIKCSFDIYPWRRAQEMIKTGDVDGMMVIGRNPKREQWVRFSPPHFRTEYGLFVKADIAMTFTDISQLEGMNIAVFSPSNTATQLKGIREGTVEKGLLPIKIDERPDDDSGFRKLAAGRVDPVYSNRDRGRQILEAEGLTADVRYTGGHQGIFYYVGFARSSPDHALIDRFNAAWRELFGRAEAKKSSKVTSWSRLRSSDGWQVTTLFHCQAPAFLPRSRWRKTCGVRAGRPSASRAEPASGLDVDFLQARS